MTALALAGALQGPQLAFGLNPLRLDVPTNAFAVTGQMKLILRGTVFGYPYNVLTKEALAAPVWTPEQPVVGTVGRSTDVALLLNGRTTLFVSACPSDDSSDSTLWTADTTGMKADMDSSSPAAVDGAPLTADTTKASTDTQP
jgi:hypothetical protein